MASLILLSDEQPDQIFPLATTRVMVGRNYEMHIRPPCTSVSRMHASIVFDGTHYILQDHGSMNGTYVNGRRVERHILEQRDMLRFGSSTFLFDLQGTNRSLGSTDIVTMPRRGGAMSDVSLGMTMRVTFVKPATVVISPGGLSHRPDQDSPPLTIR